MIIKNYNKFIKKNINTYNNIKTQNIPSELWTNENLNDIDEVDIENTETDIIDDEITQKSKTIEKKYQSNKKTPSELTDYELNDVFDKEE